MSDYTCVYLITGFLGSGKTTFLNRLIHQFPEGRKLMILMNEFGEIGVDGALVAGKDLDILEISKGSVFCACVKTDFIRGLFEIARDIKPDVLIIESTGVANPTDLKKDLALPIFNSRFQLMDQICVVDAANFLDAFQVYVSVERQIASSTKFIINKVDIASFEKVRAIKSLIKKYHPNPHFCQATFADIDIAKMLSLRKSPEGKSVDVNFMNLSEEELDRYIDGLMEDLQASLTPPDILMSAAFRWESPDLRVIPELTGRLPREVVRAKGFITPEAQTYLYNYVMGRHSIEERPAPVKDNQKNILVFIFPPRTMAALDLVMNEYGFLKIGELVPGAQGGG